MKTYTLTLSRMKFFGRHGVYASETASGQRFDVSAELVLPLPEGAGRDQLEATIDYCKVQDVIRSIVEGIPRRLIETVAEELADSLLDLFPSVSAVSIEVFKPEPPVTFEFEGVSVRVHRTRVEWNSR